MYAAMYPGAVDVTLKACRACLATDVKLYDLHKVRLADAFADITKTPVYITDGLPQHICYVCHSQLNRCLEFRDKCRGALMTLQNLRARQLVVTTDHVRQMDTSKLVAKITRSEVLTMDCVPEYNIYSQQQHIPVVIPNIIPDETNVKEELLNFENDIQYYELKVKNEDLLITASKPITHEDISVRTETPKNDEEFKMEQDHISISDDDDIITKIEIEEEDIKLRYDNHANYNAAKILSQDDLDAIKKLLASKKNVKCNRKMMEITHDESMTKDKEKLIRNVNKKKNIIRAKKQAKIEKPKIVKKVKRKRMYNRKYIEDYEEFAKEYNIEVVMLSKTEQKRRIEERKALADCVKYRLTCGICYKGFMTEKAYKRHMKLHDPSYGKFVCDVCQCRFQDRFRYGCHVRAHRKEFVCRTCRQTHHNVTAVKMHHKWHQGHQYECRYCHRYFKCYNTHVNHIRETHTPVACKDCGKSFDGTTLLNKHRDSTHTQCQTCNAVFRRADVLQTHTDEGCQPDNKSCTECGASFDSELELRRHCRVHGRGGRFKCNDCESSFTTDRRLGCHWAQVHAYQRREDKRNEDERSKDERSEGNRSEDIPSEDEGSKGKQSKNKRSKDKRSEDKPSEGKRSEDKPNEDEGSKGKQSKNKRSKDKRSEDKPSEGKRSEDKPNEDEGSKGKQSKNKRSEDKPSEGKRSEDKPNEDEGSKGKQSKNKRSKDKRSADEPSEDERSGDMRSEGKPSEDKRSEDEPSEESDDDNDAPLVAPRYHCETCASRFKSKITLRLHKNKKGHNEVLECPQCDKTFTSLTSFKVHLTYHKGVRPHLCAHCPDTFKTYEAKTRHIQENHSQSCPHKCSVCGESFVTRRHLERHVLHRHLRGKNDPSTPPPPMAIPQTQSDS